MSDSAAITFPRAVTDSEDFWTVHQGDARNLSELLARGAEAAGVPNLPFLQATITSPPYATLVDYGSENQIGYGESFDDYLASCRSIFEEVHRWTLPDGSMWVVADSLMAPQGKDEPSRLIPLPFELASEAKAIGWTLREVIIWRKDRTRPWSHRGKLRNGFEYVLLFVKSKQFKFNVDRLRDTGSLKSWWVKYPERHNPWGMTPDNVWDIPIPVQGSWDDSAIRHACPFPPELVRRMVALSSDEGDIIFDPFAGSGQVITTARREGRRGLGIELNPSYVRSFKSSEQQAQLTFPSEPKTVSLMTQRLLELRMLKYPKELAKQVLREGFSLAQVRAITMTVNSVNYQPATTGYASIKCRVVVDDELSELENARLSKVLLEVMGRAPLSRYGLEVTTEVTKMSDLPDQLSSPTLAVYTRGRTWSADRVLQRDEVIPWLKTAVNAEMVPVLSPLRVEQALEEAN